jgi:hypothetical protein
MYKATREIEVTFNNNKVKNITIIVFDIAIDNARAKLAKEVEHYRNNPCTVKVANLYEYFESF